MLPNWLFIIEYPQHKLVGMPSPNLSISCTKIKCVIAQWIALLIIKGDGHSLIFVKVANPNIIKAVAKSPCNTHPLNKKNYTIH